MIIYFSILLTMEPVTPSIIIVHYEPKDSKFRKYLDNANKRYSFQIGLLVAVLAMLVLLLGVIILMSQTECRIADDGHTKELHINDTTDGGSTRSDLVLRHVTRDEWLAQPPTNKLGILTLPVSRVVVHHTATEACFVQSTCVHRARYMQSYHMYSNRWDDIGYNFLIGEDGLVYDGRGCDSEGTHTKGYNRDSVGIAFIGTFIDKIPLNKSISAFDLLIAEGIRLGKLKKDYKLYGARQLNGSESPGEKFFALIKSWTHWSDQI